MSNTPGKVDITAGDGARIALEASTWANTTYAPNTPDDTYKGAGAEKKVEADCSGSVWKIYCNSGLRYEYTQSGAFDRRAALPEFPFRKLTADETPQKGDVVLYNGHMAVYAGDGWGGARTNPGFHSINSGFRISTF